MRKTHKLSFFLLFWLDLVAQKRTAAKQTLWQKFHKTLAHRPIFQNNLAKPVPEKLNQSGF